MLKEFKEFVLRGNVVDLAVATILGVAFNNIIKAVVDNILMPLIGILIGGKDFNTMVVKVGDAELLYGTAISATINFIIVAFFLFLIIKTANKFNKKAEEAAGPTSEALLQDILNELRKGK